MASAAFTLAIAPSSLVFNGSGLVSGVVGTAYSASLSASGGTSPYAFSLATGSGLPAGLSLSSSGVISGTPTTSGSFSFVIKVTDSGSPAQTTTATFTLTIAPTPLVIGSTLPSGTVGTLYDAVITVSGGSPPYTFALAAGSTLPAGLALSSSGAITGIPAVGSFTFSVKATDSGSPAQTSSANFSLTIAPTALSFPPGTLPTGLVGAQYATALTGSGGLLRIASRLHQAVRYRGGSHFLPPAWSLEYPLPPVLSPSS